MTTTVQQIVYTSETAAWHRLAVALGFTPFGEPAEAWSEFDADGVLAVHRATPGDEVHGTTQLHLLVDDLDAAERALSGFVVERSVLDDVGPLLTVTAASGAWISVSGGARTATGGPIAVEPLWFQRDGDEPRRILEALGLRPVIESESGGWTELAAPGGGRAAFHGGDEPRIGLSFAVDGDLDAVAKRVTDAGFEAAVIDESYARTLRIADPDGGEEIWVNGRQDDLYGYRRVD